eukprot:2538554-Amphidinium_carterae.1
MALAVEPTLCIPTRSALVVLSQGPLIEIGLLSGPLPATNMTPAMMSGELGLMHRNCAAHKLVRRGKQGEVLWIYPVSTRHLAQKMNAPGLPVDASMNARAIKINSPAAKAPYHKVRTVARIWQRPHCEALL